MTRNDSPPLEAVDQMLSRFLKAEMPQPWPKAPSIQQAVGVISPASATLSASSSPLANSRFSLAASLALILGGCWLLSSLMSDQPSPNRAGSLEGGNASTKPLNNLLKPAAIKPNKMQP